jgi:hypothetical protein
MEIVLDRCSPRTLHRDRLTRRAAMGGRICLSGFAAGGLTHLNRERLTEIPRRSKAGNISRQTQEQPPRGFQNAR